MRQFQLGDGLPGGVPRSIVCIGAHCDDIEIGCGGLLMQLCAANPGIEISWFIAAAPAPRAEESRRAAGKLLAGCTAYTLETHEFPDGLLPFSGLELKHRLREFAATRAQRLPVDLILTHYRDDAHQDHRFLCELTWQTFRDHVILEYEIPKYDGDLGQPNWFVPLERATVERKLEYLLGCFDSQRDKPWFDAEVFRGLMRLRGVECRAASGFAEAFHLRKGVWQITT
jgi:LmbE family N-acetylglucosaminyl deacetylase